MTRRTDTAPSQHGTRDRILAEFANLVADQGYHATSIADIAETVGVSKGAILHYFTNKDAILDAVGVLFIQRRDEEIAHAYAHLERTIDQFAATVYSTLMAQRDDRGAARTFGREFSLFQNHPRMEETRTHRDRYVARVQAMLARCMDDGVLRRDNVQLSLLEIFGMCNWTWTWFRPDGPLTAEEIAGRFVHTLLHGMGPNGGVAADVDDERVVELILQARQSGAH